MGCGTRRRREQSTGTRVTATKSETLREKITTMASDPNMMLAMPVKKRRGTNTATCVKLDATIADHTSSLPLTAAVTRSWPFSM